MFALKPFVYKNILEYNFEKYRGNNFIANLIDHKTNKS